MEQVLTQLLLQRRKADGNFDDYAYVALTDATTYSGFFNINRNQFANANDTTKAVSSQTEEDAARRQNRLCRTSTSVEHLLWAWIVVLILHSRLVMI